MMAAGSVSSSLQEAMYGVCGVNAAWLIRSCRLEAVLGIALVAVSRVRASADKGGCLAVPLAARGPSA